MANYRDQFEIGEEIRLKEMAKRAGFATVDEMYSRLVELKKEIESIPPAQYTDTATLVEALRILGMTKNSPSTMIKIMDEFLMKRIIG